MVGKVYRTAKDMMIRLNGSFAVDLATRRQLYDEVTRLVRKMEGMEEKSLVLELNFPDERKEGLHERWSFLRALKVTVTPR